MPVAVILETLARVEGRIELVQARIVQAQLRGWPSADLEQALLILIQIRDYYQLKVDREDPRDE